MQDQPKMVFYVYVHRRATDRSIFYVGKGTGSRSISRSGRNRYWGHVSRKYGFISEIVQDGIPEKDAFELEIFMISELRASGCALTNLTDGGEGAAGLKHTQESRYKLRMSKLGRKQSPEHAAKSAAASLGTKRSPESIKFVSDMKRKPVINSSGEIFDSIKDAATEISSRSGKETSSLHIAACARGERNSALGFTWSYDIANIPKLKLAERKKSVGICGSDFVFASLASASEWVSMSRGSANYQLIACSAASDTRKAYGYKWYYLDNNDEEVA
jgi:hypothetical protein